MPVEIKRKGPLFDGRAPHIVHRALAETVKEVSTVGLQDVRREFAHVLRHPTGYLESHVVNDVRDTRAVVSDKGRVLWSWWIEGTGSRNRTTRFKGYWTFKRMAVGLRLKVRTIARPIFDRYTREMNGL